MNAAVRFTPREALAASDALEAAVHLVDDDEAAETLAVLADQWWAEAAGVDPLSPLARQLFNADACTRDLAAGLPSLRPFYRVLPTDPPMLEVAG